MEIRIQREVLNDINYDSNYDEIFEDYSLELDGQTTAINKFDIHLSGELFSTIDYRDGNDKLFENNDLINSIGRYD